MKKVALIVGVALLAALNTVPHAQQPAISSAGQADFASGVAVLVPTKHPPVPSNLSQAWLAPELGASSARTPAAPLSIGVKLAAQGQYSKALTAVLEPITQKGILADYSTYYAGVAQLR